jgi:hypothetical protein
MPTRRLRLIGTRSIQNVFERSKGAILTFSASGILYSQMFGNRLSVDLAHRVGKQEHAFRLGRALECVHPSRRFLESATFADTYRSCNANRDTRIYFRAAAIKRKLLTCLGASAYKGCPMGKSSFPAGKIRVAAKSLPTQRSLRIQTRTTPI